MQKIAIVGLSFRFPGDLGGEREFWDALCQGRDLVTEVPSDRWATDVLQHPHRSEPGRSVTFSAGVLSRVDAFDAGFFGISPREAAWIDPQQRLLLELAWEAMENAGMLPSRLAGSDCAVCVGISNFDYGTRSIDDLAAISPHTMTGSTLSIAANRLSYAFDLRGPSMAVDTACSSSLVALHQACNAIRLGEAPMALVGGVNMLTHPFPFIGFSKASMLSARGRCRAFDASGDGYVRAEGGAVLLLKPLEQAEADGNRIHAVILASGVNADGGRKTGLTIPSREGQIELMRTVIDRAGVDPAQIDYLEAHGTGTAVGDPVETAAIGAVYGQARPAAKPLPIGSVKTNLGHLEPASGMAGLIKALLVLKHRQVPPSLHLQTPNPKLDLDGWNLRLIKEVLPLHKAGEQPLLVGVNSFGFGGANAHVILSAPPLINQTQPVAAPDKVVLPPLLLSARCEGALRELAGGYAKLLGAMSEGDYYDHAYAAVYRRERLEMRLLVAADSPQELAQRLEDYARGGGPAAGMVEDIGRSGGALAFVYAGNGAQWKGMGQFLLVESDSFRDYLVGLEKRMAPVIGFSLIGELQADEAMMRLDDTAIAQPLLFALQVAITWWLRDQGIEPAATAGHSVGEVAAAWAAGALTLDEAVRVIGARSTAQALTRGAGKMAAVNVGEGDMRHLLAGGAWPQLEIAGVNSPGNVTLSGPLDQLESLFRILRERGTGYRLLDLDYAFHSKSMDLARENLDAALADLAPGTTRLCRFFSTVSGKEHPAVLDAAYWWDNIRQPVRFQSAMETLAASGCRTFVEISPHAILQRYIRECLAGCNIDGVVLPSLKKGDDGIDRLQALALGLHLRSDRDTLAHHFPYVGRFVDLPAYPWQRDNHCLPSTVEGYGLIARYREHPLLGWRLKELEAGWENVLDPRTQPWLADHRVGGAIVLPGAAYVEMALAAGRLIFGGETLELEGLDILSPIVFDGEHGRSLRFEFTPRDGGFLIRSRQRLANDEWTLNACGRLQGEAAGSAAGSLSLPAAGATEVDQCTHYHLAQALGLEYGPAFQRMQQACVGGDRLSGRFSIPAYDAPDDEWQLAPALVDTCFQSLLHFCREEIDAGRGVPLLPVKIGRLRLFSSRPPAEFRAHLVRRGMRSVLADFELFAVDGKKVAELSGCRFRAAALRHGETGGAACWQTVSVVQPSPAEANQALAIQGYSPRSLSRDIRDWLEDREVHYHRQQYFGEVQPLFDALVTAFACEAVRILLSTRRTETEQWLQNANDPVDEQHRLWVWVRDLLTEQSILLRSDTGWLLADGDMPAAADIWRALLAEHPACLPELALIGRKGRALPDLLIGALDPAVLAGEVACSHQLDTLYDHAPAYLGTRLAVEHMLDLLLTHRPPAYRLRVLEVVAGPTCIPRELGHFCPMEAVDYVVASSSAAVADYLRHDYLEQDWISIVDLDARSHTIKTALSIPSLFDVVVLRHVLGSAATPVTLVNWAYDQLAGGGLVVIAERYPDLAAELLGGDSRLLAPKAWEDVLADLGCEDIETCREPAGDASPVGSYLVLGKRGELPLVAKAPEPARWLFLADGKDAAGLADDLREILIGQGQVVAADQAGMATQEAVKTLLTACEQELDGVIDHVVLLAGKRRADDIELPVEALQLVQMLATMSPLPRLTMVTHNARGEDPVHAALWGFGRVVMNEMPGLRCRLIDCAGNIKGSEFVTRLGEELLAVNEETEVVLQPGERRVLRTVPAPVISAPGKEHSTRRFRLDFQVPGQLRNLLWLEHQEASLGPEDVEVRPLAAGLNFRDVMYVMGLLPDEAVERGFAGASLGLEFSGVVTRVGGRVDEFVPGDAVMGFGSACFASHVVTRANALAPKPDAWTFEAAATVPTVFFTVYYALKQLANLQPGERVLVHGGAGGVGIAAIQLARHLGAEIFATAGTAEKRQFVELLGADHVFDSRKLDFAQDILAVTGGEGVDVVLNSLAGEAIRRNFQVLRPFGRFLELGKRDFFENTPIGLRPFKDNITYFGIDADQLLVARPELAGRLFREVMALFRAGVLSPLPARVFSAERVVDAFRYMQQARQIGKVVVDFEGNRIAPHVSRLLVASPSLSANGVYLVTGGLTGFGLETARWLARCGAGRLVLLGRRGMATEGAVAAVESLRALGAEVVVHACDVADRVALRSVLEGPDCQLLKGVFHAAMVIDDAVMANLDADRMRRVLVPKVKGGWYLHELTRHLPLDHFVLYSSITTVIGNPGQANYVAANAWLEGMAGLRRAAGLPVTCIGWGPIGDAGYLTRNQAVKDSLAHRLGAAPLASRQALEFLGRILTVRSEPLAVGDFQFSALSRLLPSSQGARFQFLQRREGGSSPAGEPEDDIRSLISGKAAGEVNALVVKWVTREVAQILAVSSERVDAQRSLHDLGLDSLMGVELAMGLEKRFGIPVPAMLLNEGPTVQRVAERIIERLAEMDGGSGAEEGGLVDATAMLMAQHGVSTAPELIDAVMTELER